MRWLVGIELVGGERLSPEHRPDRRPAQVHATDVRVGRLAQGRDDAPKANGVILMHAAPVRDLRPSRPDFHAQAE